MPVPLAFEGMSSDATLLPPLTRQFVQVAVVATFEDIVQPGVGPPRHVQRSQDEVFFVLDGIFDIEIDGQLFHPTAGDVAYVPRGAVHAFKNVGTTAGRLRYTFTPAGATEIMFRAFYAEAQINQLSPERMAEIAIQHDQEFVGSPL